MPEAELIRSYLAGEPNDCLAVLYSRYYAKVYRKCLAMIRDADAAQDHTQEIFLKAFGGLARFGHRARFETWLHSITHHYCVDQIKRSKASGLIELTQETIDAQVDPDADPPELAHWVDQAWNNLPESSARLLRQKYLQGLSVDELAVQNQTSASAIKMRLFRARQALRQATSTLGEALRFE